ncbi:hypothetical protein V1288_006289 [Bradyrhizobium sp. AZCC 2176]
MVPISGQLQRKKSPRAAPERRIYLLAVIV